MKHMIKFLYKLSFCIRSLNTISFDPKTTSTDRKTNNEGYTKKTVEEKKKWRTTKSKKNIILFFYKIFFKKLKRYFSPIIINFFNSSAQSFLHPKSWWRHIETQLKKTSKTKKKLEICTISFTENCRLVFKGHFLKTGLAEKL